MLRLFSALHTRRIMKFSRFGGTFARRFLFAALLLAPISRLHAQQPSHPAPQHHPWDDKSLSPDERADLVIKEMTLDEKIQLVHGTGGERCAKATQFPPARILAQALFRVSTGSASPISIWPTQRLACAWLLAKPLCHVAALDAGRGFKLGPCRVRNLWRGDRTGTARAGLQHVDRRRRGHYA